MSSPLAKQAKQTKRKNPRAEHAAPSHTAVKDAVMLLHSAAKHMEMAMRLLAEATLLQSSLDDSLGLEAQQLRSVRDAVRAEIQTLENQRLRVTE